MRIPRKTKTPNSSNRQVECRLGNNHAYLGRAYVTLRTHKANLSELDADDWSEFEDLVRKLENAYIKAFEAVSAQLGLSYE
jgi:diadenosine tetraphosphate (Ap4A) HIT family hydrolase